MDNVTPVTEQGMEQEIGHNMTQMIKVLRQSSGKGIFLIGTPPTQFGHRIGAQDGVAAHVLEYLMTTYPDVTVGMAIDALTSALFWFQYATSLVSPAIEADAPADQRVAVSSE